MTAQQVEYPSPPWVELYAPTPTEQERRALMAINAVSTPEETWHHALTAHRILIIAEINHLISAEKKVITEQVLRTILDTAWQATMPIMQRATGPMIAEAYIRAFKKAKAGDVPIKMVYALAEEHARRTGEYFHGTSSDALVQGFNTYVNRQVPEKAAITRVLDAYGLTPRQMSGLTSSKAFETKVASSFPANIKKKVKAYIGRSIATRLGLFTRQEAHNLDQQAQQVAWMWMRQHGKIPTTTEKMWITAKDEKVCAICGPLHRTKIPVGERFVLEDGQKLYVPGAHPNCRCAVRLQIPVLELVGKADDFLEREHPRGGNGRFVRARTGRFVPTTERMADPQLERMFQEARRQETLDREEALRQIEETPVAPEIKAPPMISAPKISAPSIKAPQEIRAPLAAPAQQIRSAVAPSISTTAISGLKAPDNQQILAATSRAIRTAPTLIPSPSTRPSRRRRILRSSIQFVDRNSAPQTVYMVVPNDIVPISDFKEADRFFLGDDDQLSPWDPNNNHEQIAREVQEQFHSNLDNKVDDIMERAEADGYGAFIEDEYGNPHGQVEVRYVGTDKRFEGTYTNLDEATIRQVVMFTAMDSGLYTDNPISLNWLSPEGDPVGHGKVFLKDLGESPELAVDPEELKVLIVQLNEGHEEGFDMDPGSRHGEEAWTAPGNYLILDRQEGHKEPNLPQLPIEYWSLVPEVDETELARREEIVSDGDRFRPPHGSD